MKISINKIITKLTIYYPAISCFLVTVSNVLGRTIAQVFIVLLAVSLLIEKRKGSGPTLLALIVFTYINAIRFGVDYIIHQDFYGFFLLILIFIYYSNPKNIMKIRRQFNNKQRIELSILFYYLFLFLSIAAGKGLMVSAEWGVSIPMLYGPYSLPHSTAYQLIVIYAMSSILYHQHPCRKYVAVMVFSFGMLMWTGVRSAFLAIFFMVLFDICSVKKYRLKATLLLIGPLVLIYLAMFTNILTNNPIIQKTLTAAAKKSGITNSRTDFNSYLMNIYLHKTSFVEKMFGIGMDRVRRFMYLRYGTELHAHNDILNSLLGMGIAGLYLYVKNMIGFCKSSKKELYVFVILFVLCFTNGLYMYLPFIPSIVILIIYSDELMNARIKNESRANSFNRNSCIQRREDHFGSVELHPETNM